MTKKPKNQKNKNKKKFYWIKFDESIFLFYFFISENEEKCSMKSKYCILFTLLFLILSVYSDTYKLGDKIPVIVDKVWPKSNPSETYNYFSLSFCPPKEQLSEGFAYAITGSRKYVSNYKIEYAGLFCFFF